MCAIAGVAGRLAEDQRAAGAVVASLISKQKHRGPDGEGFLVAPGIALAHRRLAIVDLSDQARQPMTSRNGRWSVVFNGELFNYRDLKKQLDGPWVSASDTEVLLEACARWGVKEALERSAGMFGLALWDHQYRELTLARDRLGEKPLVYYWDGSTLAFASEMKALAGLAGARLNPAAVDCYFALGYVPAPLAIYERCGKLEAGTLLKFIGGQQPRMESWWTPGPGPAKGSRPSTAKPAAKERAVALRNSLGPALRDRLLAPVPIALSLSGGIDSSVLAAESVRQGASLETFAVRFTEESQDVRFAALVARHLGLRHHVLDASTQGLHQDFSEWVQHYDEPFADSSAVGALALARALGGHYKVILTGDGGDEAFAGYRHYEYIGIKQVLKRVAAAAGKYDIGTDRDLYVQSKITFRKKDRRRLLPAGLHADGFAGLAGTRAYAPGGSPLRRAMWIDRYLQLANGLTYKMDIALGAFGLEGRSPFLDHRLLGWADQLPDADLVQGRQKKVLLRAAYRDLLPQSVLERSKQGFGAPIREWLAGPLREAARELLPCPLLAAGRSKRLNAQQHWTLLMFSAWARRWGASW